MNPFIVLFYLFLVKFADGQSNTLINLDVCLLPLEASLYNDNCKNMSESVVFYYDADVGICREFSLKYNCIVNGNQFPTVDECEKICKHGNKAVVDECPPGEEFFHFLPILSFQKCEYREGNWTDEEGQAFVKPMQKSLPKRGSGCACKYGLFRHQGTGKCIPPEECPIIDVDPYDFVYPGMQFGCPAGEDRVTYIRYACSDSCFGMNCPSSKLVKIEQIETLRVDYACTCEEGYKRHQNGRCILEDKCPKNVE